MTQEEKLGRVIKWLDENKIKYIVPRKHWSDIIREYVRIVVCSRRIFVAIAPEEKESDLFHAVRAMNAKPLFIRESENVNFVLYKLKNALKGWNTKVAKEQEEKAKTAARTERKRIRTSPKVERVNPNRLRAAYDVHCAEMAEKENHLNID